MHDNIEKVQVETDVRQGDNMSPNLFTLVLENAFKRINLGNGDLNITYELSGSLRFANSKTELLQTCWHERAQDPMHGIENFFRLPYF